MRVVCSWCGTFLAHALPLDDPGTTHGICRVCRRDWETQASRETGSGRIRVQEEPDAPTRHS